MICAFNITALMITPIISLTVFFVPFNHVLPSRMPFRFFSYSFLQFEERYAVRFAHCRAVLPALVCTIPTPFLHAKILGCFFDVQEWSGDGAYQSRENC